jgi:anti-sigma regulatory factor (Ser/Thr protein kinase)
LERTLIDTRPMLSLPPSPGSIRAARQHVERAVQAALPDAVAEDAVLLVSELATNAVLHARTSFTVVVDIEPSCVRVEVHDESPVQPVPRNPEPLAPNGRGLQIVRTTADRWGTNRMGWGKTVWFELDRPVRYR